LAPFLAPVGFLGWWVRVLQPRNAFITWIPTLAAAIACGYLLRLMAGWSWYQGAARALKRSVAAIICAIVSGLIYETSYGISTMDERATFATGATISLQPPASGQLKFSRLTLCPLCEVRECGIEFWRSSQCMVHQCKSEVVIVGHPLKRYFLVMGRMRGFGQ
jgi:hypothetical protein